MKKLIMMLGVVAAAFLSNADYLVWQVTPEESKGYSGYNYIAITYAANGSSDTQVLDFVSPGSDGAMGGQASTDLSSIADGTKYSLYVEFINYQSAGNWNSVGTIQGSQLTYQSQASNQASCIVVSDTMPATTPASVQVWHGSAVDVPEPTSGMMVMLGFAFLALKRRKV